MKRKTLTTKEIAAVLGEFEHYLAGHEGGIKLVGWRADQGVLKIKLTGHCQDCRLAPITLQYGLQKILQQKYPRQVKRIEAV